MKKRLYVDMDGTLAVFTPVDTLETLYQQGYFLNQEPHTNVIEAVRNIVRESPDIEVNILSAYLSDSDYALDEKNAWLDKYLPEISAQNRIFLPCGEDKKSVIKSGVKNTDYLLDDYTKNLTLWQPPGSGIKLLNGINHTHKSWEHDCVSFEHEPKEIADKIIHIMRGEKIIDTKPQGEMLDVNEFLIAETGGYNMLVVKEGVDVYTYVENDDPNMNLHNIADIDKLKEDYANNNFDYDNWQQFSIDEYDKNFDFEEFKEFTIDEWEQQIHENEKEKLELEKCFGER